MPIWPTDPPDDDSEPASARLRPIGWHGQSRAQQAPEPPHEPWGEDNPDLYTGHPDYEH